MRAAIYHGPGDVRIEERATPGIAEGEVLLRITRSGICGTDATEWRWGPTIFPVRHAHPTSGHHGPLVIGHEFIGVVERSADASFRPGERVASGAGVSCGDCARCDERRTNLCAQYRTYGLNIDGGLAEFAAVRASTLSRIPESLSDDAAALVQPLAVGVHAAKRSGARSGDHVVVLGAGAIGTFVLAGIRHLTDARVTVIDFAGERLARAARLGAHDTIAVDGVDYAALRASLARQADVVVEASGAPGQLQTAAAMTRDGGGILQVGMPAGLQEVDVHQLVFREITLRTTMAHVLTEDFPDAWEILQRTDLREEMLDSVHALEAVPAQLERLASGRVGGKVLFDPAR